MRFIWKNFPEVSYLNMTEFIWQIWLIKKEVMSLESNVSKNAIDFVSTSLTLRIILFLNMIMSLIYYKLFASMSLSYYMLGGPTTNTKPLFPMLPSYRHVCVQCKIVDLNRYPLLLISGSGQGPMAFETCTKVYTLSHPENDRDVTERAQGYTLQDASIPVFLFESVRKHTSCPRGDKCLPPEYALTSRSFSR